MGIWGYKYLEGGNMKGMVLKAHRHLRGASSLEEEKEAILEAKRVLEEALAELGHALRGVGIARDPARQRVGRLFRDLSAGALPEEEFPLGELLRALEDGELERRVREKVDRLLDERKVDPETLEEMAELRLLEASSHTLLALSFLLRARREAKEEEESWRQRESLLRGLECAFLALAEACAYESFAGLRQRMGV